ncbi:MAG: aminotransferase class V-fold PLP-dependent enzyme [Gemmatimonas sp.]|nr:aminotransferase class V-fold PLP-dependent enzyme [Gemmatimonas sp.]
MGPGTRKTSRAVSRMTEIYLDYAATSAVRPPVVLEAIAGYLADIGATPGRSGHRRSLAAGRLALRCRKQLAELLGYSGDPGRVTFQLNATHALNVAIVGTLRPGDRVIGTAFDHNSVRRPLTALARRGVSSETLELSASGETDLVDLRDLLSGAGRPARLLVIPHASNVTGTVLPVKPMVDLAHEFDTLVLLDAAQTMGHFPVDVEDLGVDLVAFSGHKGLAGPQGTGGLWVREGVEVEPLLFGGTGGDSGPPEMPATFPDHLEAGTQNAPGIAGLAAATEWVLAKGVHERRREEMLLKSLLLEGLRRLPSVRILSAEGAESVGIVTLLLAGRDPGELAMTLDRDYGIQTRAGLHCAPGAHRVLGTLQTGALRLSVGWATTAGEIEQTIDAFKQLDIIGT